MLAAAEPNLRTPAELIGKTQGAMRLNGYTDAKGEDDYNLDLSKRRADALADWLVANGIAAARLQSIGHGEADPIAPNARSDGSDDPKAARRTGGSRPSSRLPDQWKKCQGQFLTGSPPTRNGDPCR